MSFDFKYDARQGEKVTGGKVLKMCRPADGLIFNGLNHFAIDNCTYMIQ